MKNENANEDRNLLKIAVFNSVNYECQKAINMRSLPDGYR